MKNQEIALKAYAAAILGGSTTCQQDAWIVWRKSLELEVPEDPYDCYLAFCDDEEWGIDWDDLSQLPTTKQYLATYWAIQTLQGRNKVFKEYLESNEITIAALKSGLLAQLTQA